MGDKILGGTGTKDNSSLKNIKSVTPANSPVPKAPPNQIVVNNESIIILRTQSGIDNGLIEELEEKYSQKFGCKVVILEANLGFVDVIDG